MAEGLYPIDSNDTIQNKSHFEYVTKRPLQEADSLQIAVDKELFAIREKKATDHEKLIPLQKRQSKSGLRKQTNEVQNQKNLQGVFNSNNSLKADAKSSISVAYNSDFAKELDKCVNNPYNVPAIVYAVLYQKHEVVKYLIESGEDVNVCMPNQPIYADSEEDCKTIIGEHPGMSLIAYAIENQDLEMIKILLAAGADVDVEIKYYFNVGSWRELDYPENLFNIHYYIMDLGDDPSFPFDKNELILMRVPLLKDVQERVQNQEIAQMLLNASKDYSKNIDVLVDRCMNNPYKWPPIAYAAIKNMPAKVVEALIALGEDVNAITTPTPIYNSASKKQIGELPGVAALYFAAMNGNFEMVHTLFDNGADIKKASIARLKEKHLIAYNSVFDNTFYFYAEKYFTKSEQVTPLEPKSLVSKFSSWYHDRMDENLKAIFTLLQENENK